jgi:hypothetical protein
MAQVYAAYTTTCPYCNSHNRPPARESCLAFFYRSRGGPSANGLRRIARRVFCLFAVAGPTICLTVKVDLHLPQPLRAFLAMKLSDAPIGPWVTEVRVQRPE